MGSRGLASFTENLVIEFGQYEITMNTVSPGITLTNEVLALDDRISERQAKMVLLRRISTPKEVATVVLFFASPWSDIVTGGYPSGKWWVRIAVREIF
ncbi:MAG: SDR family oxidoreductase [Thermodesulfobacteriota bacterium]|nr:SDR family oxidoreductase [Thermodesulfobacteriota bacterium]